MNPVWLQDAVFYEIYPQSFYDSNGDGIGDINGIRQKLDYIRNLGCNALWLNPCFDSPFKDAGYDVRDYLTVAPRYGSNEDLYRLFAEAHEKGIHVLLDLVPGHTSEEHPWFLRSKEAQRNEMSDRYIWTDFCFRGAAGMPYIGGESDRDGCYILNFFKCQPALNYGFYRCSESWQKPIDDPAALRTREAMKEVMRFWLDHGCDGFRVDMADSLVKCDEWDKRGTAEIWRDVRRMLDAEYPEAALVAEWNNPALAIPAGFHMCFYLNETGNGYSTLMRDYLNGTDRSYFKGDAGGDIRRFLDQYLDWYDQTKDLGYISMITCNHDTIRPSKNLSERELKLAYAFLFTMPGVPFLYYGDEIGMRYLTLPTKEGGYYRTGSRTPMQWQPGKNLGFSTGDPAALYLPTDPAPDAPTVAAQEADPDSLLQTVRRLLALRHAQPDLQSDSGFSVLCDGQDQPFVYRRGALAVAVNPARSAREAEIPGGADRVLLKIGEVSARGDTLLLGPQSFAVVAPVG